MTREDNLKLVHDLFAAGASGVTEDVLSYWANDGVIVDHTLDRRIEGKGELRPYLSMFFAAFPGLSFTPMNVILDGDKAVVEWVGTALHRAEFFGIPPTGRTYALRGVDIFEIRDGKIQEERSFYGDGDLFTKMRA
jgi:steroid delta-isomerase-like uncharacterized protein